MWSGECNRMLIAEKGGTVMPTKQTKVPENVLPTISRMAMTMSFVARHPLLYLRLFALKVVCVVRCLFPQSHLSNIPIDADFGNRNRDHPSTDYVAPGFTGHGVYDAMGGMTKRQVVIRAAGFSQNGMTVASYPRSRKLCLLDRQQGNVCFTLKQTSGVTLVISDASATWRQLETFLNRQGFCAPVLTDVLDTTIGGTLSVGGGYGPRSIRYGAQFSSVETIWFVAPTGRGEVINISQSECPENRVVGRFGRDGVITRVAMGVLPLRPFVVRYSCLYASLGEQLLHLESLLHDPQCRDMIDQCSLKIRPLGADTYHTEFAIEGRSVNSCRNSASAVERLLAPHCYKYRVAKTAELNVSRMRKVKAFVRSMPPVRVWCDFLFEDIESLKTFVSHVITSLRQVDVIYCLPVRADYRNSQRFSSTPIYRSRPAALRECYSYGVGLYRFFSDDVSAAQALDDVSDLYAMATELAGRPYLYGAFPRKTIEHHLLTTDSISTLCKDGHSPMES